MYLPYLRAKQNEMSALYELNDEIYSEGYVVPIIEPVTTIRPIQYRRLMEKDIAFILVVNPIVGALRSITPSPTIIDSLVNGVFQEYEKCCLGFIIHPETRLQEVRAFITSFPKHQHAFIHFTPFARAEELSALIAGDENRVYNIFIDGLVGVDYVNIYKDNGTTDIIVRDGFVKQRRNEDYPPLNYFDDLHKTYEEQNYHGFGDFTIIGSQYDLGGGPAYVVALHLSDIDKDNNIIVHHFKSDATDPPSTTNPGGKFLEALNKLIASLRSKPHLNSTGVAEYRQLHNQAHFPGLGVPKKVSIKHHIELVYSLLE